jgi:GNAT superfamily N-acetyltransferase
MLVLVNDFFNSAQIKSELHWFTHRDTLKRAAEREDRRLFYIEMDGRIRAALMVWCESRVLNSTQAQIRLVAVHPDFRGRGIGEAMVEAAMQFARSCEKDQMIADVAEGSPAVRFWQACGFTQAEEYQTSGGRDMYRMATRISR